MSEAHSALFERLERLFHAGSHVGSIGLRDDSAWAPPELRPAAVLIAVTDRPDPGVLLTHRPDSMPSHPGQVAFPGGKLEPGEDAVAAALREAREELAIDPGVVRIVGTSESFVTGSGFTLTPVLGLVPPDLAIVPEPREVASWFEAPLRFVLDQANHVTKVGLFRGHEREYTEIDWQGHRIWGITASILSNLSHRMAWQELVDG
ncbi:MAG TPA: CoA pyrophosphatase [Croceibacterium sp.]|jgi:8-oxo-dGTP pyrophosphatase MutT (NUDIX family)